MATHDQLKRIVDRHAARLAALPNVVGVGIGTDEGEGGEVVAVYVEKKVPLAKMAARAVVPRTLAMTIDGKKIEVPTRVIEVGRMER